jgi:hypothetical protein
MIKCVIIDDEQPAINVLENYIKRVPYLNLVGKATNPIVGIELINNTKAELVFLEIQMDEMSGIDVIKVLTDNVKVIFCSAYSEFAVTSYELNALDYLMKPISFDRFASAIKKISPLNSTSLANESVITSNDYIFVKTEQKGKMVKIDLDDIDFIEAMNNYIAFYRGNSKTLVYSTMKEIEGHLPSSKFIRIHKSYIIAINKITTVYNKCIVLKNRSEQIPISLTFKTAFMQMLTRKVLNGN